VCCAPRVITHEENASFPTEQREQFREFHPKLSRLASLLVPVAGGSAAQPWAHTDRSRSVLRRAKSMSPMSDVCPSLGACAQQLLAAAVSPTLPGSTLLFVTFTDADGLTMALNWAMHLRRVGVTPVLGLDGQMPSQWGSTSEDGAWRSLHPVLFSAGASSAAHNGYQRWRLRWDVVSQLLALGPDVMMSDTDVVWLRDPRPYMRALIARHPLLDVLIGTDHALYAEALQEGVAYTSRASPTRRDVVGALPCSAHLR